MKCMIRPCTAISTAITTATFRMRQREALNLAKAFFFKPMETRSVMVGNSRESEVQVTQAYWATSGNIHARIVEQGDNLL